MQTLMEQQRKLLLKKFHTLLGKAGIGEDGKMEMLAAYGVTTSRDLSAHDLLDLCNKIEQMIARSNIRLAKSNERHGNNGRSEGDRLQGSRREKFQRYSA